MLAGPPLVQTAIGQRVSGDQLGGARMHLEKTRLVTHVAEDEQEAINMVLGYFRQQNERCRGFIATYTALGLVSGGASSGFKSNIHPRFGVLRVELLQDDEGGIICAFAEIQSIQWAVASNGPITA